MAEFDKQAILESFRRRAGQQSSSAGIPGGAPVANVTTPGNPLTPPPGEAPGAPQGASDPGRAQLAQSKPGEAEMIIRALSKRLSDLGGPSGGAQQ